MTENENSWFNIGEWRVLDAGKFSYAVDKDKNVYVFLSGDELNIDADAERPAVSLYVPWDVLDFLRTRVNVEL